MTVAGATGAANDAILDVWGEAMTWRPHAAEDVEITAVWTPNPRDLEVIGGLGVDGSSPRIATASDMVQDVAHRDMIQRADDSWWQVTGIDRRAGGWTVLQVEAV